MARISWGIISRVWAASGDTSPPQTTPVDQMEKGWDSRYSQVGGEAPRRGLFNWLFRALFAFAKDVNERGVLEWDATVSYKHPAYTVASDGRLYTSLRDNTNADPTTSPSDWKLVIDSADGTITEQAAVVAATTESAGIVELATDAEMLAQGEGKIPDAAQVRARIDSRERAVFVQASLVGGTANAITLTPTPAVSVRSLGDSYSFFVENVPTGAVTLRVGTTPAANLTLGGAQVGAGGLALGDYLRVVWDGTAWAVIAAELGSASLRNVGAAQGNLVELDASGLIPAARLPAQTGAPLIAYRLTGSAALSVAVEANATYLVWVTIDNDRVAESDFTLPAGSTFTRIAMVDVSAFEPASYTAIAAIGGTAGNLVYDPNNSRTTSLVAWKV